MFLHELCHCMDSIVRDIQVQEWWPWNQVVQCSLQCLEKFSHFCYSLSKYIPGTRSMLWALPTISPALFPATRHWSCTQSIQPYAPTGIGRCTWPGLWSLMLGAHPTPLESFTKSRCGDPSPEHSRISRRICKVMVIFNKTEVLPSQCSPGPADSDSGPS